MEKEARDSEEPRECQTERLEKLRKLYHLPFYVMHYGN